MRVVVLQNQTMRSHERTTMRLLDRLKALRDTLESKTARDPDKVQRDKTDSSAAPIVDMAPDSISASVADLDAAGFPPNLR